MSHWVFLRGLARERTHWGDFPDRFRAALPGATLHLPDLPGNGTRHRETSPCSVSAMVQDCREWLHAQGIHTPVRVLALSLGGMVAAEWAQQAPNELDGMVLINTSLRPFSPVHHRLRPHNWPRLLRLLSMAQSVEAREQAVWQMTSRQPEDPRVLSEWIDAAQGHPVRARNVLRQLLAAARYRASAQAPAVPALLLAGQGDALVDPRCSAALAQAWQLPLRQHPWAGHDLPLDDPAWVAEQVRGWLHLPL